MIAIIFPGQGSQYKGMTKDFFNNFKVAREVFELVSDTSNIDIKDIIFDDQSNLLNQTKYTQLSLFCSSISIFEVLKNEIDISRLKINCMLGHSLGEYTALTASNIISIKDCTKLLKIRGDLMQNAYPPNKSAMAALIGIDCGTALDIINDNNLKLEIANDNSPMQVVISGLNEDITKSEKIFKINGVKRFVLLNVSAAFHSFLMNDAQDKMKFFIEGVKFNESNISIISNFTGKICLNTENIVSNLSNQMSNRVRWVESIKTLKKLNISNVIEIGPGKVLSGLIKRITDTLNVKSIDNINDIENFL